MAASPRSGSPGPAPRARFCSLPSVISPVVRRPAGCTATAGR
ncbi:hypothetical protein [Lysobacter gummosus]